MQEEMWSTRKEVGPDGRSLESRVGREISEYRGSKHQFSQAACITLRNLDLSRSASQDPDSSASDLH